MPPDDSSILGAAWGLAKGLGTGVGQGALSMAEGIGSLATGAYHVATDPQAAQQAWDTTKQIADAAKQYTNSAIADPATAYNNARDKVLQLKDAVVAAHDQAAADGTLAEFYGRGIGRGVFEAGTFLVGAGEVGAVAKAGEAAGMISKAGEAAGMISKAGEVAEVAGDVARAAKTADKVGEAASASEKAAAVAENPAVRAADEPASAVKDCPYKKLGLAPAVEERIASFSKELSGLSVATEKDKVLLYSGVGGFQNEGSRVIDTANSIIDRTPAGAALEKFQTELSQSGLSRDQVWAVTEPMWRETSVRLASEASGKVTAVMGSKIRDNAVIFDELKALSTNPKVTSVEILKLDEIGKVVSREFR